MMKAAANNIFVRPMTWSEAKRAGPPIGKETDSPFVHDIIAILTFEDNLYPSFKTFDVEEIDDELFFPIFERLEEFLSPRDIVKCFNIAIRIEAAKEA